MKKITCIFLITFFLHGTSVFAQKEEKLTYYVGFGPVIDGNIGLWGLNFNNELSFKTGKRSSINPSLTFYQSISSFDNFEDPNLQKDNSSGLFMNATFRYDLIKTAKNFKIALAIGPSFQLGSENTLSSVFYTENQASDYRYQIESFKRMGITQQIILDWPSKNENRINSALITMSSFEGYWPWYLMATYRIGFHLN